MCVESDCKLCPKTHIKSATQATIRIIDTGDEQAVELEPAVCVLFVAVSLLFVVVVVVMGIALLLSVVVVGIALLLSVVVVVVVMLIVVVVGISVFSSWNASDNETAI